jgi:hypothetical protein
MELGWIALAKAPSDEQRSKERAPACVPECTTRSRERVGATTYRCRSGIATAGPASARKRACIREPPASRRRRLGSRSPVRFHDVRMQNDLGRTRSFSRAKSRREAPRTATGASEVERQCATSTGRKRPTPACSSHRSAHGVVKTPSAPVSRRSRGVARRHGRRDETRSPHDTMGARFRIRG